jgi:NTP pyrophosphatase (non-canonical NTP hydrolase)
MNATIQQTAIEHVVGERVRQQEKWGEQNHSMFIWLTILGEEVGELSECVLHERFGGPERDNLFKEAVQVAAVSFQIVEYLLRKQNEVKEALSR